MINQALRISRLGKEAGSTGKLDRLSVRSGVRREAEDLDEREFGVGR